jgi:hypothetical protein
MKRREFIAALGGVAAWPRAARGQKPAKLPTVGFLGSLCAQRAVARAGKLQPLTAIMAFANGGGRPITAQKETDNRLATARLALAGRWMLPCQMPPFKCFFAGYDFYVKRHRRYAVD